MSGPKIEDFKVTCTKCKQTSKIRLINDVQVFYIDQIPIIGARFRADKRWGFQCICGNDSRIAPQEKNNLDFLVQMDHDPMRKKMTIGQLLKTMTANNHLKFKMERA